MVAFWRRSLACSIRDFFFMAVYALSLQEWVTEDNRQFVCCQRGACSGCHKAPSRPLPRPTSPASGGGVRCDTSPSGRGRALGPGRGRLLIAVTEPPPGRYRVRPPPQAVEVSGVTPLPPGEVGLSGPGEGLSPDPNCASGPPVHSHSSCPIGCGVSRGGWFRYAGISRSLDRPHRRRPARHRYRIG